ncbi:MAG: chromosome segregation protein SMC [Clostridiales Family XIII bacterium]|jgi:chromosome segregation protein|nr:chromosome segregation protein SMC [Clostridiales Family XIII bacterium]
MYLKRIEIQGFKSFADAICLDFKEGLSCVVGPNGSGKSNISDAMRWVLGEQSARTLRGTKMEEIIFAGTETRRPKGMAEVTLVFDNSEGILPIDYSEVAIKRRLFRSGESEYFINNSQCRLRDVRDLLMDTGIGVEGYSFVGQGQIDRIVNAKPEELREIFEEAAGVIKYKNRKLEAQRRLDSAQGNLDRMNDIIFDIEDRIDGLREESEKAKAHAALTERHRDLEINITLKNIESTDEKNKTLRMDAEEATASIQELYSEKEKSEKRLTEMRVSSEEKSEEISHLVRQIAEAEKQISNLEGSVAIRNEKERGLERDRNRIRGEMDALNAKVAIETEEKNNALTAQASQDEKCRTLRRDLEENLDKERKIVAHLSQISNKIDASKGEIFELTRRRSMKEQEVTGNAELIGNFDSARTRLEEEYRAAEKAREGVRQEIAALLEKQERLQKALEEAETQLAKCQNEQRQTQEKIDEDRLNADKIRNALAETSARKRTIEEMESNYEGYNAGVKAVMKQNFAGIEGVVAELIEVPKGLETAIETALGGKLQNIVTIDEKSAKKAVEFLKANKAGRLTFLPIDRIQPDHHRPIVATKGENGFVGLATELIGFDAKYSDIMEYLLGKVLIAESLDDAIAFPDEMRRGYRIVTKDGEVINPSGALTGGAYENKSANLLERRSEISSLAKQMESLGSDLGAVEAQIAREGNRLTVLGIELEETDREERALTAQLADLGGEKKSLEFRSEELETRIDRRSRDLINIQTNKESGEKMNIALRAEIDEINVAIAGLEASTKEAESEIDTITQEKEAMSEAVTVLRVRVAEAETEAVGAEAAVSRISARLLERQEELASKQEELIGVEKDASVIRKEEELLQMLKETHAEKETLSTALMKVQDMRKAVLESIVETEKSYKELSQKLDTLAASKSAMDVELGRQEIRLASWKEKLYEEFDLSYVHALEYRRADFALSTAVKENREIKNQLFELGDVNPGSIRDYEEVSERYDFLTEQREDILKSLTDYQKIVEDMDKISRARFRETFDGVVANFDGVFKKLFGGGKGTISLEEGKDPLESGILIQVQPPGKTNLLSMHLYSGGERTMIGIALLFSILEIKPAPFCILDEVDAALDETNIKRFADYLRNFADVQFALITHQRTTMEYANTLFGVTMQEQGVTSILSLLLGDEATEKFAESLKEN